MKLENEEIKKYLQILSKEFPAFLIEYANVFVVKDGKENNQGVAYLEDGTMIVVEGGKKLVGENTAVVVTSVLQTSAGRMIFAKLK